MVLAPRWLSIPFSRYGLVAAGEVEEPQPPTGRSRRRAGSTAAGHPGAVQVGELHGVGVDDGRCPGDGDRVRGPRVAGPVAPEQHPAVIDVDEVGRAVAVDVAEQQPPRVVAVGQPGCGAHLYRWPEAAVAQVRPVRDVAAAHQDDVLQAVAGHVGEPDRRVGQIDSGDRAFGGGCALPGEPGVGVVEEALQP